MKKISIVPLETGRGKRLFSKLFVIGLLIMLILPNFGIAIAADSAAPATTDQQAGLVYKDEITDADLQAAADSFRQAYYSAQTTGSQPPGVQSMGLQAVNAMAMGATPTTPPTLDPGGVPHYFGPYPNWAYTPLPKGSITGITVDAGGKGYSATPTVQIHDVYGTGSGAEATATVAGGAITSIQIVNGGMSYTAPIVVIMDSTGKGAAATPSIGGVPDSLSGGIRKFVDALPTPAVGVPDKDTYPGSDYYVIELGQYTKKMHTDLAPTTLRGYRQINGPNGIDEPFSYLGPIIIAERDVPVRIKFINNLPTGDGGNLFIPVDHTAMGAGMGPLMHEAMPLPMDYSENRANLHLHGAFVTWISDGTPHQWTTPAGEMTAYPKGVSVYNVPDMEDADAPQGTLTYYYNNEQSARLQFYHDHSWGITRLNVYAGEAAGYIITDQVEQDMIEGTDDTGVNPEHLQVLPDVGIPLIIQDKTFVDASTIAAQDPTWNWGTTPGTPNTGDLWYPHVYMTAQNPYDLSGANAFGRWHYAAWFHPPATNLEHPPVPNPYYDPVNAPWEPPYIPGTPNPSMVGESFMDTPLVNGMAYPYMEVEPKAYRFRILNAANDRFFNLQLYEADPTVTTSDGRTLTEVKMVAAPDGRDGGIPDPATAGPSFIQIGTEGGFLPKPAVIDNQPITWNLDPTAFNFGNVDQHALLLGCAERADVVVDFSQYAGKTLILYNDAPAAFPALDTHYDYYTGNPDQMDIGGAPSTQPGYGPNTRTIMQIKVAPAPAGTTPAAYDLAALESVFAKTATKNGVFETSQDPIIVPQAEYNSAYNANLPADPYVRQHYTGLTFKTLSGNTVTVPFEPKAIQDEMGEAYDLAYGRMSGMLGLELPNTVAGAQNFILYPFTSPPVDILEDSDVVSEPLGVTSDGTQIWKITHNGVDTHPIHFHLYNVQLINRVAWDGKVLVPDANELGWKETVRVNPLEHTYVAMRPTAPTNQPFEVPNSVRLIDPSMPEDAPLMAPLGGFKDPEGNPVTILNHYVNYGWEYVYHCHILAHEEMDMMHTMVFAVAPRAPTALTLVPGGTGVTVSWTDNSATETSFTLQRATSPDFTTDLQTYTTAPDVTTYNDASAVPGMTYYYRVQANNLVGDTGVYASSIGFPTRNAESTFTNTLVVVDGTMPTVQFSAANYPVDEDAGPAMLTVTLSQVQAEDVTVDYSTSDGTATAGQDYTVTSGTLTIPAGETSGTFAVPILDDTTPEAEETLTVTLSNPSINLGSGSVATVTLLDNDGYVLSLQSGWNLVSIPLQPANNDISAFFPAATKQHLRVVWTYDAGNWYYYTPQPGFAPNTLNTIDTQHGYWVYVDQPVTIPVSGTMPATPAVTTTTGWNLVGNPTLTARNVADVYGTAYVTWGYDNPGNWYYYTPRPGFAPNTLTTLTVGKGYWVYIP